jgi:DNA-binding transcriptional MerR regulator
MTLAKVLGISVRSLATLEAEGVLVPTRRGKGRRASEYALGPAVQAYVEHAVHAATKGLDADAARARRDEAQAAFVELKVAQARRELLPRSEIERHAVSIIAAARDRLLRLEHELARAHDPAVAVAVALAVKEALQELAALATIAKEPAA